MENKSKEEILKSNGVVIEYSIPSATPKFIHSVRLDRIEKSMQEYADLQTSELRKTIQNGCDVYADDIRDLKSQLKSKEEEVKKLREEKTAAYNQAIEDVIDKLESLKDELPVVISNLKITSNSNPRRNETSIQPET